MSKSSEPYVEGTKIFRVDLQREIK